MTIHSHSTETPNRASIEFSDALDVFASRLREIAHTNSQRLEVDAERDLRFALVDLLPSRVRAIKHYLVAELADDDVDAAGFVTMLADAAESESAAAQNASDIAEALIQALEDLHSFVLAHDLVERRYRLSQGIGWVTAPRTRKLILRPSTPTRAQLAHGVDSHEYALAA